MGPNAAPAQTETRRKPVLIDSSMGIMWASIHANTGIIRKLASRLFVIRL
ncbi:MAG: hypothetical protein WBP64_09925 [Nitrososphaeraceae archaeon]